MVHFHLTPFYSCTKGNTDCVQIPGKWDLTVTAVALSWPLVSVHLTQLGGVSSRGECWNALTQLRLRAQNPCFLQRKQRHNLGAEKKRFGFTSPSAGLLQSFGKHQCDEFSTSQMQVKAPSLHSLALYTQEDQAALWLPGHCTTNTPQEPFQSQHKGSKALLNSTKVSLLFSWSWVSPSHLPFLSQATVGEAEGLFWVSSQSTTKLKNDSCIYLSTAPEHFSYPSTPSNSPSVPHFLPGQHHLYIFAL